jgi:hypothetical protein
MTAVELCLPIRGPRHRCCMRRSSPVCARARKPKTKNRRYSTLVLGPLPENAAARRNLHTDRRSRARPDRRAATARRRMSSRPWRGYPGGVAGFRRQVQTLSPGAPPPPQARSEAKDQQGAGDQRTDTCSLIRKEIHSRRSRRVLRSQRSRV